ncbi:MAG: MATE family efflux transporter [Lachnospira sp.]|nr:MATE family efflux transporter [Lachnospira sp.]
MNTQTNNFATGSIIKHMLKLALPMTLAQLVNVLYNIIDRIYIGQIPNDSTNALTGLGVAFPICTVTIAFANLVGMGGAPLFSIERGRGNEKEAGKIMGNSFVMLVSLGILISIIGLIVKKPVLYLLGASDATYSYANSYITIYLLGTVFVMLSLGLNSFINAQGFGKIGMITVSIGAVLNIILDPVFIFVLRMGVQGAAVATVISQFAAAMWTIRFLTGKKTIIKLSRENFSLKFERVRKICALGLSGFTMAITNSAVQMAGNSSLSIHGGDMYIAAMTVINSVREVVQMPVLGISNSSQPIISFNYGAKEYSRVKQAIRYMAVGLFAYTLIAWIFIMIFSKQLIQLFNSDTALLSIGITAMHIYFFGFFFMAFQFTGQSTFTALGKSKHAVFFSLFRKVFIVIPLIYLLPLIGGLGVNGVFLAEPVSNLIGGLACFITMYISVYRKM